MDELADSFGEVAISRHARSRRRWRRKGKVPRVNTLGLRVVPLRGLFIAHWKKVHKLRVRSISQYWPLDIYNPRYTDVSKANDLRMVIEGGRRMVYRCGRFMDGKNFELLVAMSEARTRHYSLKKALFYSRCARSILDPN